MASKQLIDALLRRREQVVKLEEGKSVTIRRPPETQMGDLLTVDAENKKSTWRVGVDDVKKYTVGWDGFTEADILGPSVGGSDPVPWDKDLFAVYIDDNQKYVGKIAQEILDSVVAHVNKQAELGNDSGSGST